MKLKQSVLTALAMLAVSFCPSLQAAPLPDGSTLNLDPGSGPDFDMCTSGSCFGVEYANGLWIWNMLGPGNDGGIVVGKNQLSGGQELAPSSSNTTPGDMTAAWYFYSNYGTYYADNALNNFSDTSNDGTTALNDFNFAWNNATAQLGGGSVNDYTITLDGLGGGSWSMDYTSIFTSGAFTGANFRLIARGAVATEPCVCAPVVNEQSIAGECGELIQWLPEYTDIPCSCNINTAPVIYDLASCAITSNATNGNATVNADCSGGTYTSGAGYEGADSFNYSITDSFGSTVTNTVNVQLSCTPAMGDCDPSLYPVKQVTTVGGGQGTAVNTSLSTTFTGRITTDSGLITGGKNAVKICPGSTVDFLSTSTIGVASCQVNGAAVDSTGTLTIGDKLICTNKPDGGDVDRFTIKNGF